MTSASQGELRKRALRERRALSQEQRTRYSHAIATQFFHSAYFFRARHIGVYLSTRDEVDTQEIVLRSWRAKKTIYAPVIIGPGQIIFRLMTPNTPLSENQYGILEPSTGATIPTQMLDVAITPLAAFDRNKNRIGMGGGYYDRHFAYQTHGRNWRKPKLIGFAFACQETPEIVANPWDISLCGILSERRGKTN